MTGFQQPAKPATAPAAPANSTTTTPARSAWEEDTSSDRIIITFYGPKGVGKTSAVYGLSGRKYVISLDGKSKRVADTLYAGDKDITVANGRKHWSEDVTRMTQDGADSIKYIEDLLVGVKEKNDAQWIVFDYHPTLAKMGEMAMRRKHNFAHNATFQNRSAWEDRNAFLRKLHRLALDAVGPRVPGKKFGVVYVTYVKQETLVTRNGETFESMKKPNYSDAIEQETDIVFRVDATPVELGKMKHTLTAESNKLWIPDAKDGVGSIPAGKVIDLTGPKKLRELIGDL